MTAIKLNEKLLEPDLIAQADALDPIEHLEALREKSCLGAEFTGWWDYPQQHGFALEQEIQTYIRDLDVTYDLVLVVGIGGSYLGTRAVTEALLHSYQGLVKSHQPLIAFAGHHISETQLIEVIEMLDKRLPIVNIISKSGTTTEPGVAFRILRSYLENRFGKEEAARRIVCTTDANAGALRQVAREEGYKTFSIPDDVGGRFSVLTAVGLVPLALLKLDTKAMLEGASRIFQELSGDVTQHPVLRYAALRSAAYRSGKAIELLSTNNPKLTYIVEWWKQLFGESEGKEGKGLFPAGMVFTTDLHSLGQYVQEGERRFFETFLSFENDRPRRNGVEQQLRVPTLAAKGDGLTYLEGRPLNEINNAAMQGTMLAHTDGKVPSIGLQWPVLNEYNLGSLFAFFETACAISAGMLAVNAFDQPGVEAYKQNLFALLGKPGSEALRAKLKERMS
ncbi:MAG: glucose-6-phosphate isomerase [Chitinophagaceae bacterium]|nr:glucose-6-phosphate isomerase [Oligoflexus sp.]